MEDTMAKDPFPEGTRVKLKADEQEGWPEQYGTSLGREGDSDVWMVSLDEEYRDKACKFYDDGLREVTVDQLERA
jgi:hypothetical protein